MLNRRTCSIVLVATVAFAVGTCERSDPYSAISTRPDGLRTFNTVFVRDGIAVVCGLARAVPPLAGTLEGDDADPLEPVWLVLPDGRRVSVVWSEGFGVVFAPDVVLRDPLGRIVARDGDQVELPQVSLDSATGTFEDPYIAACSVFGETYPYMPDPRQGDASR